MSTPTLAIPGSLMRGEPGKMRRRHCDRCDVPLGGTHGMLCSPCVADIITSCHAKTAPIMERLTAEYDGPATTKNRRIRAATAAEVWCG
ncbi:hypothetical protein [Pseudoclavibacter helvolus]|uniref:hypothetical protein n=1 Tax=Pseudoclavibacter helvolus TaxID=255205 RepID=UPI003C74637C